MNRISEKKVEGKKRISVTSFDYAGSRNNLLVRKLQKQIIVLGYWLIKIYKRHVTNVARNL